MHLLEHILGLDSPEGDWYLFWSGFGADLAYVAAIGTFWRRHICRERGCWRFAHHGTRTCHKHAGE